MMKPLVLVAGIALLALAWLGPLPALAALPFSAHMTTHMIVVAIAAPLVALGLAGTRLDPVNHAPALFAAIPASLLEFVVVWGWHVPALHQAARHEISVLAIEQGMFAVTGLLLWLSVFGGGVERRATGAGVLALLLTFMHMTLLGALLALTSRSLYGQHAGGIDLVADQQLGGVIMLFVGGASYLTGGLWLMAGLLRRPALLKESQS